MKGTHFKEKYGVPIKGAIKGKMLKNSKTCKCIANVSKKDCARNTNYIDMNVCDNKIDQSTGLTTNNSNGLSTSHTKNKKHKSDKLFKHQSVKSKKDTGVDPKVKTTGTTCKKSCKRESSLINPTQAKTSLASETVSKKDRKRTKLQDRLELSSISLENQPVALLTKKTKMDVRRKSKDFLVPLAGSADTQTEISLSNETPSKKGRKRQKPQDALALCGVGPIESQLVTLTTETLPKKAVRQKSKDCLVLSAGSADTQTEISLSKETPSKKGRKRQKPQERLALCGVGPIESQLVTLTTETLPKKAVGRKSKDCLVLSAGSTNTQTKISLSKETPSKKGRKRRKPQEGLALCGVGPIERQLVTLTTETLPKKAVRRKSTDFLVISAGSADTQTEISISNETPSKKSRKRQKPLLKKAVSRKSTDFLVLSAGSADIQTEISLSNETPSKKGRKRQKSHEGLALCGVGPIESQLVTLATETLPKQAGRRKFEDVFLPSSVPIQPIIALEEAPLLPARTSLRLNSSKDLLAPEAFSSEIYPVTKNNSPFIVQNSKEDHGSSAVDCNIQSGKGSLKNMIVEEQKPPEMTVGEQKSVDCHTSSDVSPVTVKGVEGDIYTGIEMDCFDVTTLEEYLLMDSPSPSPGISESCDHDCTEKNNSINEEEDDNLEGIMQHIQTPMIEHAGNYNLVCSNVNQNISVESMLISPVPSEHEPLSTDSDIAIKECNIVIERLDLRYITEYYNRTNKKQENNHDSFKDNGCTNPPLSEIKSLANSVSNQNLNIDSNKLLSEAQGHSSEIIQPSLVESNCKDVSVVNLTGMNQEIVSRLPKLESMEPSNSSLAANDCIAANKIIRPKLDKASILKGKRKLKYPNCKQIKSDSKTNSLFGLERTFAFYGGKKNITDMVITKTFTKPEILTKHNESKMIKQICHDVSAPKSIKTCTPINDEIIPMGIDKDIPWNDGALKQKHLLNTKLHDEGSFRCDGRDTQEGSVEKQNLQNAYVSQINPTCLTFQGNSLPLTLGKDKLQTDRISKFKICDTALQGSASLACERYGKQDNALSERNLQNASGSKIQKTYITFNGEKLKGKHYNEVLPLKEREELRRKASLVSEKKDNQESALTKQNLHNTRGDNSNKTYIKFDDNFDFLNKQTEEKPQNNGVIKLKTLEHKKLKEITKPRNLITFKETETFVKVATHYKPISSINVRSNFREDTELPMQNKASSSDFAFTLPKSLHKQKVTQNNEDDDDDISSEISIFISRDVESAIDKVVSEPKKNKRTWNKFDRHSKYSDDEEEEEDDDCNNVTAINSHSYDLNKKSGMNTETHLDEDESSEEKDHSYAPSSLTVEKIATWNQLNQKYINEDNSKQTTSRDENNKKEDFCDTLLVEDPLQDSPLNGYCILYFRTSNVDHTCNLMHKVPIHLFSDLGFQDADKTDCAIGKIIKEHFNNPPAALVFSFVSFCVRFNKRNTLVRLGKCLKNSFNSNKENANEIWYNFLKAIIDSNYFTMNIHKCRFISMTLQTIFGEDIDAEVFAVILEAIVTLQLAYKSQVQLLMCVDFLFEKEIKHRVDLKLIPYHFAISVLKQYLETLNEIKPITKSSLTSFAFKVAKVFFTNFDYFKGLLDYDRQVVTSFVETTESKVNLNWLRCFNGVKQFLEKSVEPLLGNRKRSESGSPLSGQSTKTVSDLKTIECASDSSSLCAALERNFEIGKLSPREIYECLKSTSKKEQFYNALTLLSDPLRKGLSDVIMSLISGEANNSRWNICYRLYESLNFDPKTIKNFERFSSPASNVLTLVLVLLMNNKIIEALNLFTKYNLCKDSVEWDLNCIPRDVESSRHICSTFMGAFQSLDEETLYSITMKLVPLQKSLAEPIDLTAHVGVLINGLIKGSHQSKAAKLITLIFDENKSKLLTLPDPYLYRALVIILCNAKDMTNASMLFFKAEKRVFLYPALPKNDTDINTVRETCVELYSCLTRQEMKVVVFAVLKLHGEVIKNSGFYVKFKVYEEHSTEVIPSLFKPYISHKDDAVPTAILRFRQSVRELIPYALFKERGHDSIEIDKISLKEYMHIQSTQI